MTTITFKGKTIHTVGELPAVGKKVPDFTLTAQDLSEKSLQDYKGKKIILNIFPSFDTPVCAKSVREFFKRTESIPNLVVLNVSMDLPFAASKFCAAEGIKNTVTLSAFRSPFPKDYGVLITDGPLKGLCSRATLLLDENNQVIYHEQVPEIAQEPNYDAIISHAKI